MTEANSAPVLVLAPGRDSALTCRMLEAAGYTCESCNQASELLARLRPEIGAIVIAEEALRHGALRKLADAIAAQPAWSDLPVLVVAQNDAVHGRLPRLAALGNVSVLTRPMAPDALVSAVSSALRARRRQFQARALIQEQEEQARRKDEFLAMLAHELRNPLAPVRYAAQVLRAPGLDDNRLRMITDLLERQVSHMARIIDDLLDVSRVTRGITRLSPALLDLADLARRALDAHSPAASARGVRLRFDAPGTAWVNGDATRLKQVLDNLVDNAIKFSSSGGEVGVEVRIHDHRAELAVRDCGEGIEPDILPRLFQPFMQADRSLDRRRGGLGLGLALVRGLTQLHGGEVTVHSEGPGRGSTFVVRLPDVEPPVLAASSAAAPVPHPHSNGVHVLVAEDNTDAADALGLLLELAGCEVTTVHTGEAAVAETRRTRPDVLVCDIGLPGLDGYQVAQALRRDPALASMRLIAVTGYGGREDRAAALEAGFDEHLPKPVEPARLVAEITKSHRQATA